MKDESPCGEVLKNIGVVEKRMSSGGRAGQYAQAGPPPFFFGWVAVIKRKEKGCTRNLE